MKSTFPRLASTPVDSVGSQVHVLAAGPWHAPEFSELRMAVAESESWCHLDDVQEVIETLDTDQTAPDLILVAQPLPGQILQEAIDKIQRLAPLTRIVIVAGSWCEGEMRTGQPLSGVLRLYWYQFAPWWAAALSRISAGLYPHWSIPLDSAQAGRFVTEPASHQVALRGAIAISALDYSVYATFAAALPSYGLTAVWARDWDDRELAGNFRGGIWDGGQLDDRQYRQLRAFCQEMERHGSPVVALLDFPRVEHGKQARQAGAQAIYGKPYIVSEIADAFG
ncbi:MAG: hypothetical protein MK171_10810 [Pirellulales bacterium]|nr:hypothetical protein [Pirellulales bacterium]